MPTIRPIEKTLDNLALVEIARWFCQSDINGPKTLWVISQLCNLGEERANANAATNIKTVVGSRGTKTPIVPKPTQMHPKTSQKIRFGKKTFMTNAKHWYLISTLSCHYISDLAQRYSALIISSTIFLASASSIMVPSA